MDERESVGRSRFLHGNAQHSRLTRKEAQSMFGDWILSEQLGADFAARGQLYVNTSGREACAPGHRYGPAKRR